MLATSGKNERRLDGQSTPIGRHLVLALMIVLVLSNGSTATMPERGTSTVVEISGLEVACHEVKSYWKDDLHFCRRIIHAFLQTSRLLEMKQAADRSRKTRDRYVPAKGLQFSPGLFSCAGSSGRATFLLAMQRRQVRDRSCQMITAGMVC